MPTHPTPSHPSPARRTPGERRTKHHLHHTCRIPFTPQNIYRDLPSLRMDPIIQKPCKNIRGPPFGIKMSPVNQGQALRIWPQAHDDAQHRLSREHQLPFSNASPDHTAAGASDNRNPPNGSVKVSRNLQSRLVPKISLMRSTRRVRAMAEVHSPTSLSSAHSITGVFQTSAFFQHSYVAEAAKRFGQHIIHAPLQPGPDWCGLIQWKGLLLLLPKSHWRGRHGDQDG